MTTDTLADLDLAQRIYVKQRGFCFKHCLWKCFKIQQHLGGYTLLRYNRATWKLSFSAFPGSFLCKTKCPACRPQSYPLGGLAVHGHPGSGLSLSSLLSLSSIGRWLGASPSSREFSGFSLESICFPGSIPQWHFLLWGAPVYDSAQGICYMWWHIALWLIPTLRSVPGTQLCLEGRHLYVAEEQQDCKLNTAHKGRDHAHRGVHTYLSSECMWQIIEPRHNNLQIFIYFVRN